jgi:hypothetical protein
MIDKGLWNIYSESDETSKTTNKICPNYEFLTKKTLETNWWDGLF